MSKTLIIHIGHFKTGTTALQVFFAEQQRFLAKHDIEYPDVRRNHSKHSNYAFSILRAAGVTDRLMHAYNNPTTPAEMWTDLFRHVDESRHGAALISSEEFMRIGQFPKAVEILSEVMAERPADMEVRVVAYLRDPASHVRSWYNQLIKMGFPVSDLGTALQGEIDDIHYDYNRALAPWIDIMGAENVAIRPYRNNRDDPAALHRDFFSLLGISLPDGMVDVRIDPNPRLDDRVSEVIRLLQNMDLPGPMMEQARRQTLSYLQTQDALAGPDGKTMQDVREQARAGIAWLDTLPGSSVPAGDYAARLPEAEDRAETDRTMLLGFMMSELLQMRKRVNNANVGALREQVKTLEARLDALEGKEGESA